MKIPFDVSELPLNEAFQAVWERLEKGPFNPHGERELAAFQFYAWGRLHEAGSPLNQERLRLDQAHALHQGRMATIFPPMRSIP